MFIARLSGVIFAFGFTVNALAWTPFIDILSPPSAAPGTGKPVSLTISGANFIAGAIVDFDGVKLKPESVTINRIKVTVPAGRTAKAHTASVTVVNPDTAPLNGSSNVVFFPVVASTSSVITDEVLAAATSFLPAVSLGDFNGDGNLDVVAGVDVLLGNGKGGFRTASTLPQPALLVGDFNGDGILDLVTNDYVLLGVGNGNFVAASALDPSLAGPLAVGDFNGDGRLDLAAVSGATVTIGFGDGTGHFSPGAPYSVSAGITGLAAGDFNNDGKLDLFLTNGYVPGPFPDVYGSGLATVLLGDGSGGFSQSTTVPTFVNAQGVAVGDFNNDGNLDVLIEGYTESGFSNEVRLGDGKGNLGESFVGSGGGGAPYISPGSAIGDFNGDGNLDFAVVSMFYDGLWIYLGDGTGKFASNGVLLVSGQLFTGSVRVFSVLAGDFNGDGKLDLAVGHGDWISVLFQQNTSAKLPLNVTSSFSFVSTQPVYDAKTKLYNSTLTVTNASGQPVAGPVEVALESLGTFVSPGDSYNGIPYFEIPDGFGVGESKTLKVQSSTDIGFIYEFRGVLVYSGSLQN